MAQVEDEQVQKCGGRTPKVAVLYSPDHVGHKPQVASPERPERITRPMQFLKNRVKIFDNRQCFLVQEYPKATMADLLRVHTREYVDFIQAQCQRGAEFLGDSTYLTHNSYYLALLSAGGAIKAGELVAGGDYTGAFAMIRPPGHHASADKYGGYCLFNNAAILARYLQEVKGKRKVMIVDWDGHAGNGTMSIFYDDPTVFTISLHRDPVQFYPHDGFAHQVGQGKGLGYNANIAMPEGAGNEEYARAFEDIVIPLHRAFKPDMVIGCNGFDAHFSEKTAGLQLTYEGYYGLIGELCTLSRGSLAILMEGGYTEYNGRLSHVVLSAMLGREIPYKEEFDTLSVSVSRSNKAYMETERALAKLKLILSEFHTGLI